MENHSVRWRDALRFWLKLGFISFGGPAGQIALMHHELVQRKRWISEARFLHALNFCMVLPGPEAQQLATYLGWLMHRTAGGVAAGVLFVLPSLLLLAGLTWGYLAYGQAAWAVGLLYGIKAAVVALVAQAVMRLGRRALKSAALWGIAGLAFAAVAGFAVPFPLVVAVAALLGTLGGRLSPRSFATTGAHAGDAPSGETLIFDTSHTRFSRAHALRVVAVGCLLWSLPLAVTVWAFGWASAYAQMAWFFTKAALLTFGGAYAVLPYVYDAAVTRFQWVTPTQMIDGLAFGETTPGPLIMIVAFVGFIAGWHENPFGSAPLAGALGATLATWFTFLPSFLFILLGAPWVESTHGRLAFTAPLAGITAAVVGVMMNLAVFFALHVLWPGGGGFDPVAAGLVALAFVALAWRQVDVMKVILACALVGLLLRGTGS